MKIIKQIYYNSIFQDEIRLARSPLISFLHLYWLDVLPIIQPTVSKYSFQFLATTACCVKLQTIITDYNDRCNWLYAAFSLF